MAGQVAWNLLPRVARGYACHHCGAIYQPALHPEVDDKQLEHMRDATPEEAARYLPPAPALFGLMRVHDRYNAYAFCRSVGCSRFHDYGARGRPRLPRAMTRKWRAMQPPANERPPLPRKEHPCER